MKRLRESLKDTTGKLEAARAEVLSARADKDAVSRTLKVFRDNHKDAQMTTKKLKAENTNWQAQV